MRELFVTQDAETDLLAIWTYIFEYSESAADRVIDEITDKFDLLRTFPLAGRRRAEVGTNYRSLAIGSYLIFYRVTAVRVEISRILHGARDVASVFRQDDEEPEIE